MPRADIHRTSLVPTDRPRLMRAVRSPGTSGPLRRADYFTRHHGRDRVDSRWSAMGAAEHRSIRRRCARARLGLYRRATLTLVLRTAGAVADILAKPSPPGSSAAVTVRLDGRPALGRCGTDVAWAADFRVGDAARRALPEGGRPRPGPAIHEHTSDYSSAYANIISMGHQGTSSPTSKCDPPITEYEQA